MKLRCVEEGAFSRKEGTLERGMRQWGGRGG